MAKPWDDTLKKLIRVNPSAFVDLFVAQAQFIKARPYSLQDTNREADALLEVLLYGERMLLHIEFQTYNDPAMGNRLLMYNILARNQYSLPVLSCVIYLLKDGNISASPLKLTIPGGQEVLQFHYLSLELGDLSSNDILETKQVGLLPLLPLTKDGAQREGVVKMFKEIDDAKESDEKQKEELSLIGYTLASLVFKRKNEADLNWLIRRFQKMHDMLRDTPIFQEILSEGREEGLETARKMVVNVVQVRFPNLRDTVKKQVALINDPEILDDMHLKILLSQEPEEIQAYLLELQKKYYA